MVTGKEYKYNNVYFGAVALYGDSNDSKPTIYGNGSIFVECDTGYIYRFNSSDAKWYKIANATEEKVEALEEKVSALENSTKFIYGNVEESPQKIDELPSGDWICSVIYPMNLDITVATNDSNEVIVTSENYIGAVVALAFKV